MQVSERQVFDKGHGRRMFFLSLSGESRDYIRADGGVRQAFTNELQAPGIVVGAIPAVHGGENAIVSRLQGHMKMLGQAIVVREKPDQIASHIHGFDGADAQTLDRCFVENAAKQIAECYTRRKIPAVRSQIDSAEDNLADAGSGEPVHFVYDRFRWQAAAVAADKWNHAVGAAGIAAILNLQCRASVIPL